jgi:small-conductance mechanosensitive channel
MKDDKAGRLLEDLWQDLQEPGILWQTGVFASCVLLAWWLSRFLRWRAPEESPLAIKRGAAAFRRVVFPLTATALLYAGRAALSPWHSTNLLSVMIPIFASLAGIRFSVYLLRIAFTRALWLDAFERAIATLVWGAAALHLTGLLPEIVAALEGVAITFGRDQISLWALASAAFWVASSLLLALWAGSALEARLMSAEGLHGNLRVVFARLGKAALVVAAIVTVLPLLGVDLTVLSVFGGALGVGLGLGLQKIASNYVSGFILLLDRSIRLGDVITADNHHGVVTGITTRYVVVRALTGVEAIIPNDTLVTTSVLNHSYTDKKVRLSVRVQAAYDSDLGLVERLLAEIARRQPRVLRDPEPTVQLVNLADSGLEFELGFWIEDPENGTQNLRSDVNRAIVREFRSRGVQIPFPQREVRLLQGETPN